MTGDRLTDIDSTDDTTDATAATQAAVSSDYKVRGKQDAPGGTGVLGHNTATSGSSYGVEGVSAADGNADNGSFPAGVRGATSGSGIVRGVFGEADTQSGRGVVGTANKNSGVQHDVNTGFPAGVWGATDQSTADSGIGNAFGVVGQSVATSGTAFGVLGNNTSPKGYGVAGEDVSGSDSAYGVISFGNSKTDGDHEITGSMSAGKTGANIEKTTNQPIAGNRTRTTVEFDNAATDHFGGWDGTNYEYEFTEAGDYHVDCQVDFTGLPDGTKLEMWLKTDIGDDFGFDIRRLARSPSPLHVTRTFFGASAGDSLSVDVAQYDSSSQDITGQYQQTYLTITKVG